MTDLPRRLVLLLGLLLIPGFLLADEKLERSRSELAEIERRIERTSEELAGKREAAYTLEEDLRKVEGELSGIEKRIARLAARQKSLDREIASREEEAERAKQAVADREVQVRKRLAALYRSGDTGFMRILFSAESPARRAEQYDYLGRIVRRDRELIASYRKEVAVHEAALRGLETLRGEQRTVLAELQGERQTLERAGKLKSRLLARLQRDEKTLDTRLEALRQSAERLETLIKKLESAQTGEYTQLTDSFSSRKGRLSWPAAGELLSRFGRHRHAELGTMVDSRGYEIKVHSQSAFEVVWPGRVIFAKSFPGYGNLLIVDHGEGYYTLYARGARLTKKVGDRVAAGETVAFAGKDGEESLYFEIRHHGTPLDPGDWLAPR